MVQIALLNIDQALFMYIASYTIFIIVILFLELPTTTTILP